MPYEMLPPPNARMLGILARLEAIVESLRQEKDWMFVTNGFMHQFKEVLFAVKLTTKSRKGFNISFVTQKLETGALFNHIRTQIKSEKP